MFQKHFFGHIKKCLKKFKITTENKGDKFVVTFSWDKNDVSKLERKHDAIKVLMEDCCCDKEDSCC